MLIVVKETFKIDWENLRNFVNYGKPCGLTKSLNFYHILTPLIFGTLVFFLYHKIYRIILVGYLLLHYAFSCFLTDHLHLEALDCVVWLVLICRCPYISLFCRNARERRTSTLRLNFNVLYVLWLKLQSTAETHLEPSPTYRM